MSLHRHQRAYTPRQAARAGGAERSALHWVSLPGAAYLGGEVPP